MSSATVQSLAHKAVSNIRTGAGPSPSQSGPPSPHTPSRAIPSTFGSPSSLRAEEDILVVELGSRFIKIGLAGESAPKAFLHLDHEQQRRAGDHRIWRVGFRDDWKKREYGGRWGKDHELWQYDLRELDLGLLEDKLDRALREAFTKFLLIDSRPRRVALVLPSILPMPLLSSILDTFFNRFQSPMVSLFSLAVMSTVAAGARSALIVDLGWAETTVTSVYEYREVRCSRTVRGGKLLLEELHGLLEDAASHKIESDNREIGGKKHIISFEECEDIACRLLWCRRPGQETEEASPAGLPTVQEQDESDVARSQSGRGDVVQIPLKSSNPPTTVNVSFQRLADICEKTFFDPQCDLVSFDDHEVPVHHLIYKHLLQLPMDVRAICMSRIVFVGGCCKVLGLRGGIFDRISSLVRERGWDPVYGRGVRQLQTNPKLRRKRSKQAGLGPIPVVPQSEGDDGIEDGQDGVWHDAANAMPEPDPIEEQVKRTNGTGSTVNGVLRCIDSAGPWSGASLICQLKVAAMANIDRELWLQHGTAGASRPSEVDVKAQQRQSIGPGGLMRGAGSGNTNWTLGTWGNM